MDIRWIDYPWAAPRLRRDLDSLVSRPPARPSMRLGRTGPRSVFAPGVVLFYRDHVPFGGFLLVEGQVALDRGRGPRAGRGVTVSAPAVLGAWHAARRLPAPATARAATRAVICILPPAAAGTRDRRQRFIPAVGIAEAAVRR